MAPGDTTVRLTRDELFARVWAEPMVKLAPQFGISDVALRKHCVRMRIPTPYPGYWARKHAGKHVRVPTLPALKGDVALNVREVTFTIAPAATTVSDEALTGPVADQTRFEAEQANRIVVAAMLTDPHPLVAAAVVALRKAKPNEEHILIPQARSLAIRVSLHSIDRALCIFDALIKACESRGFAVEIAVSEQQKQTIVIVASERIGISIHERVSRVELPPEARPKGLHYGRHWLFTPTGQLTFAIDEHWLGLRQAWNDGKRQRVEGCLNEIMITLVATADALRKRREEREAQERERVAAEERRRAADRERREHEARVRALRRSMQQWQSSLAIREYVAAMRDAAGLTGDDTEETPLAQWLDWALRYADAVDPTHGAEIAVPRDPGEPSPYAPAREASPQEYPFWLRRR